MRMERFSPTTGERCLVCMNVTEDPEPGPIVEILGDADGNEIGDDEDAALIEFEVVELPDGNTDAGYEVGEVDSLLRAYFYELE